MAGNPASERARQAEQLLRGETQRLLDAHFVSAQFAWVEGHLSLLCILRSTLGNDLDKVIILALIGQRLLEIAGENAQSAVELERSVIEKTRLTNIESIATATGIPRESVRRKVIELAKAGWIKRHTSGGLTILPEAAELLLPATAQTGAFLDRLVALFVGMMVEDGRLDVLPASIAAKSA